MKVWLPPASNNSADGQAFLTATQTVVDSADPVNHAAATAAVVPVHLSQMLTDDVVTARVAGAALSGTEPLALLMGLPVVNESSSGNSWARFIGGAHGSIIDPADLQVTAELQRQAQVLRHHRDSYRRLPIPPFWKRRKSLLAIYRTTDDRAASFVNYYTSPATRFAYHYLIQKVLQTHRPASGV